MKGIKPALKTLSGLLLYSSQQNPARVNEYPNGTQAPMHEGCLSMWWSLHAVSRLLILQAIPTPPESLVDPYSRLLLYSGALPCRRNLHIGRPMLCNGRLSDRVILFGAASTLSRSLLCSVLFAVHLFFIVVDSRSPVDSYPVSIGHFAISSICTDRYWTGHSML